MEFLVDTGAERTCVIKKRKGCQISDRTLIISGAKGESFPVPVLHQVTIAGKNRSTKVTFCTFLKQEITYLNVTSN